MKIITNLFKKRKESGAREYNGFSDFFLHAPIDEKKKVIAEAARKANEDQFKTFNKAKFKIKTN